VKNALYESLIMPLQDEIFQVLFSPPKGVLLFGHEGSGKTSLALAIATEGDMPLVRINAKELMASRNARDEVFDSFEKAREYASCVVFVDDLHELMIRRTEKEEKEGERSVLQELMSCMDEVYKEDSSNIFIVGASRTPHLLDGELIKRFASKLLVPSPTVRCRAGVIYTHLTGRNHKLRHEDFIALGRKTRGFNRWDLTALVRDAVSASRDEVKMSHFRGALRSISPSLDERTIRKYERWNEKYGTNENAEGVLSTSYRSEPDRVLPEISPCV